MGKLRFGKKFYNSKYLIKLFYYFLSILLLMYAAMIVVYMLANKNTKEAVYDRIRSNLQASARLIDSHMEVVQNVGLNLYNTEVMQYYFKFDADQRPELWAEQYRIVRVIEQNEAIFGGQITLLYAFFEDSDRIYTSAGTYERDFFFENICVYDRDIIVSGGKLNFDAKSIEILPAVMARIRTNQPEEMIPIITHLQTGGKNAIIVVHVSAEDLAEMQKGTSMTSEGVFLIYDAEGNCILNTREGDVKEQDPAEYLDTKDGDRMNGLYVFSHYSDTMNWKYVALIPEEGIARLTNLYSVYILLAGMILTIAGVACAFYFSVRLYRPIGSIVKEISRPEEAGEKRRDDIKLLSMGVTDLLKKEEQYKRQFNSYTERYVEYTLQLLIHGISGQDTDDSEERIREYCGLHGTGYLCAVLFFDFTDQFLREFEETDRDRAYRALQEVCQALLEGKSGGCYVLMGQGGLYPCIISCRDGETPETAAELLSDLKKVFAVDLSYYRVSIGISRGFARLGELKEAYGQALSAIRYCHKEDGFCLTVYSSQKQKREAIFSFYDQKKIVGSIKLGKQDQLLAILNEVLDVNIIRGISEQNLTELYRQLFSVGQRCLEDCEWQDEPESGIRFRAELHKESGLSDAGHMRKLIMEYFEEIYELVNRKDPANSSSQIDAIKKYIEENYKENLSLDGISEIFGISSKYLSRLFKQKAGVNLTEYVNAVRVSRAKELLMNTHNKIGEIYSMVGFDSRATFLRVFKKLEGYSPKEYRELMSEHKKESEK